MVDICSKELLWFARFEVADVLEEDLLLDGLEGGVDCSLVTKYQEVIHVDHDVAVASRIGVDVRF